MCQEGQASRHGGLDHFVGDAIDACCRILSAGLETSQVGFCVDWFVCVTKVHCRWGEKAFWHRGSNIGGEEHFPKDPGKYLCFIHLAVVTLPPTLVAMKAVLWLAFWKVFSQNSHRVWRIDLCQLFPTALSCVLFYWLLSVLAAFQATISLFLSAVISGVHQSFGHQPSLDHSTDYAMA